MMTTPRAAVRRWPARLLICALACGTGLASAEPASAPAARLLERVMPQLAPQFSLQLQSRPDGRDYFRVAGTAGHIEVTAATIPSLLCGVNWYLKTVAHLQVSTNGVQLGAPGRVLPAPAAPLEKPALYPWRYALNENTDGYATAYWDEARWRREIDVLALSGFNAVLVERGTDTVLYRTLRDFGYGDEAIRAWITQPAHQNWQLMGNMCCFGGPLSRALLQKRAASAQRIVAMLRELGMSPVFPGYYGMVPADFAASHAGAHTVPQGEWNGFSRPGWLDPRDPWFARLAVAFYAHQRELFGDAPIYDMEVFQEGGSAGDVPVGEAARAIQTALLAAHPQALWMQMAWQQNPDPRLLAAVDPAHMLIVDIEQGRIARNDRDREFHGVPWLFGGLWEFGGRTTFGAPLYEYAVRLPQLAALPGNHIAGIGYFTEGLDTNPMAFDLYAEMAWRAEPVELPAWAQDYATRRYGAQDVHAGKAWQILLRTAYALRADRVPVADAGERDAGHDSLFAAQPSLTATHAATWAPAGMRYDAGEFRGALRELLAVAPSLRHSSTYRYDLVDVARQVVANDSRRLLPLIRQAYESKDRAAFDTLTRQWLHEMQLQDALLNTNEDFLLGRWLSYVPAWASSPEERARLDYDARSLLTTWGDRRASDEGELHDYANRDWAGLVADYYLPRWRRFFATLRAALAAGTEPQRIDWYAVGESWNRSRKSYRSSAHGDSYSAALAIERAVP
jgi:alpha-N-acetylglucosaminidase